MQNLFKILICSFICLNISIITCFFGEFAELESEIERKEKEQEFIENHNKLAILSSLTTSEIKILEAAQTGNIELAKLIYSQRNDTYNQISDFFFNGSFQSPIYISLFSNHAYFANYLLDLGFNINKDALLAIDKNWPNYLKIILKYKSIDINYKYHWLDDSTPLMQACSKMKKNIVSILLDFPSIDLENKDKNGNTAIMYAINAENSEQDDNLEIIRALATAGADISLITDQKALEHAQTGNKIYNNILNWAKTGNIKEIEKSQEKNCTLNIKDKDGNTPLHLAVINAKAIRDSQNRIIEYDILMVKTILSYKPALISVKNNLGLTPIHLAIAESKFDILKYFIIIAKAKVDPTTKNVCMIM